MACTYGGLEIELPMVDTRKVDAKRHVLQLSDVRGMVILAPTDDRLSTSAALRLVGACFVLNYVSC